MLDYLRYLYESLRRPAFRDYCDEGLGIKARYGRCRVFWDPHLEQCRAFQRAHLDAHVESIAVLGAGRLLDVEVPLLAKRCERLLLIDADALAVRHAQRAVRSDSARIEARHCELSGVMAEWTARVRAHGAGEETLDALVAKTDALPPRSIDTIISLNLLSQIAIYWRERVKRIARNASQAALEASMRRLQEAHIGLLCSAAKRRVLLLTDRNFLYYQNDPSTTEREPALLIDPHAMMRANGFEADAPAVTWLWHIAPKGIEEKEYGVLHEVEASSWIRVA